MPLLKLSENSWIEPLLVFGLALLLFSINLDRPPHPDELHHVLAAQHLIETGRPQIGEGEYWRGFLHTWLVAVSYEVFGEGLAIARIPSVFFVALVAPLMFFWVRHQAGYLAAWIATLLFIFSPFTVEIAQFSRFYALQLFFFVFGSICVFYTVIGEFSILRRVILGALATMLMALAVSMQVTTLMGLVGVMVWTIYVVMQRVFLTAGTNMALKKFVLVMLILATILAIVTISLTDILEWLRDSYRETPLFNRDQKDEFWFYHVRYLILYPTLWPFVGLLSVLAVMKKPSLAWFSICVFGIGFLLASFAGSKATRYLSFAPLFLTIIWGVGLAIILPPLMRLAELARSQLIATLALPRMIGVIVGTSGIVLALAIVFLMNPFWLRTATMIGNVTLPFDTPNTDWRAARDALSPWVNNADIMITTEELGATYFLGRSDIRYSPSKIRELAPDQRKEFGIDQRTGRPIITTPESLEILVDCFPRGFIVGPEEHWGSPILINNAVQSVLIKHAKPIDVPAESHLYAWGWEREPGGANPEHCSKLTF